MIPNEADGVLILMKKWRNQGSKKNKGKALKFLYQNRKK
jgi:hypothetical protein